MSNRYSRDHKSLPYCIQKLPENQPMNKQEYMIRMRMIPEDPEMYFDNRGRFLYQTKCMSQELENLKASKQRSFNILQKQAGYLKSLVTGQKPKTDIDITSMKARYNNAQIAVSKKLATSTGISHKLQKPSEHISGDISDLPRR